MTFQQAEDFVGKQRQFLGDRLEFLARRRPRNPLDDALKAAWTSCQSAGPCPALRVGTPSSIPVAIILAMSRRQSVIRSRTSLRARSSARTSSARRSNSSARATSGAEIEAEGQLDRPALPFAGVALAVRAVAANDQAGSRPAPPDAAATSRRPCRARAGPAARSTGRRSGLRRRQRRLRVEAQQRVQHGERALGHAEARPCAVQIARKTCHLWTAFSGGRAFATTWLATWASVSDRRPKGVVELCGCISLPLNWAKKICSPKRRSISHETLDSDSRKWDS